MLNLTLRKLTPTNLLNDESNVPLTVTEGLTFGRGGLSATESGLRALSTGPSTTGLSPMLRLKLPPVLGSSFEQGLLESEQQVVSLQRELYLADWGGWLPHTWLLVIPMGIIIGALLSYFLHLSLYFFAASVPGRLVGPLVGPKATALLEEGQQNVVHYQQLLEGARPPTVVVDVLKNNLSPQVVNFINAHYLHAGFYIGFTAGVCLYWVYGKGGVNNRLYPRFQNAYRVHMARIDFAQWYRPRVLGFTALVSCCLGLLSWNWTYVALLLTILFFLPAILYRKDVWSAEVLRQKEQENKEKDIHVEKKVASSDAVKSISLAWLWPWRSTPQPLPETPKPSLEEVWREAVDAWLVNEVYPRMQMLDAEDMRLIARTCGGLFNAFPQAMGLGLACALVFYVVGMSCKHFNTLKISNAALLVSAEHVKEMGEAKNFLAALQLKQNYLSKRLAETQPSPAINDALHRWLPETFAKEIAENYLQFGFFLGFSLGVVLILTVIHPRIKRTYLSLHVVDSKPGRLELTGEECVLIIYAGPFNIIQIIMYLIFGFWGIFILPTLIIGGFLFAIWVMRDDRIKAKTTRRPRR